MFPNNYVPIHNHDFLSYGDAIASTEKLIISAKDQNCPAINLSNHGGIPSIVKFNELCKQHDIKPIIGSELYFAKIGAEKERKSNHLLANIKNETGYKNMLKLMYWASIPVDEGGGYFARPRITEEMLFKYQEGLLISSACVAGALCEYIEKDDLLNAFLLAEKFKENIEYFFIEIMPHRFDLQQKCNLALVKIAEKLDIPLLATIDAHYPNANYHEAYKINTRSNRGNTEENYDDGFLPHPDLWIRPIDDVVNVFKGHGIPDWAIKQAIENTHVYSDLVTFEFVKPKYELPHIVDDANKELKRLVENSLIKKFGNRNNIPREYIHRTKNELRVICEKDYANYFLMLYDFIEYYKNELNGVLGPGRGSGAGSIINWLLGITQIDSIKSELPFERFLNEERITPPDVDIDLIPELREPLKEYLRQKYGQDHVVDIGNHSKSKPRMALTDAGRALGLEIETVKEITKQIPDRGIDDDGEAIQVNLEYAMEIENLIPYVEKYPKLFEIAKKLEGTYRSQGKHAAGICITPVPVYDCIPVTRRNGVVISQWDKKQLEDIGIQKFDLLGLATISILDRCSKYTNVKLEDIPLDDEKTWDYICNAEKMDGIFQFNSHMMKSLLRDIQPRNLEELSHVNAIGRPAVLDAGLHEIYIENKKSRKTNLPFNIPQVNEILSKTHGIVIFQEQIMYIAKGVAGFSLGKGDLLRRNFEKYGTPKDRTPKVIEEYEKYHQEFIDGMIKKGYEEDIAKKFFEWLGVSVGYSFCASHSCSYSLIGYQTAFFKANFPAEFYIANLNDDNVLGKKDKNDISQVEKLIKEAKQQNIKVSLPNFYYSYANCGLDNVFNIVLGLRLLKGIGNEIAELLERKNESLEEFIDFFVNTKKIVNDRELSAFNKRHMAALLSIEYFPWPKDEVWGRFQKVLHEQDNRQKYSDWLERKNAGRKVRDFNPNLYKPEEIPTITELEILGFELENNIEKFYKNLPEKYQDREKFIFGKVKSYKSKKENWGSWRMVKLETPQGEKSCFLKEEIVYVAGQHLIGEYYINKKGAITLTRTKALG